MDYILKIQYLYWIISNFSRFFLFDYFLHLQPETIFLRKHCFSAFYNLILKDKIPFSQFQSCCSQDPGTTCTPPPFSLLKLSTKFSKSSGEGVAWQILSFKMEIWKEWVTFFRGVAVFFKTKNVFLYLN